MPDLLEVIAENDTAVLKGWAAVYTDRAPQLRSLPAREQQRGWLTLAREFTRHATWAAETAESWLGKLKIGLREGINGHEFRILYRSGRTLCRMCLTIVELGDELSRQATAQGAVGSEVQDAHSLLSAARQRIEAADAEFASFAKLASQQSPEASPELFDKGKGQIEQGKWLTPEQARAALRRSE